MCYDAAPVDQCQSRRGLDSFGLAVVLPCPSVVELAALAGYDFIRIDCEHAMMDASELRTMLQTARLLGIPARCGCRIWRP